MFEHPLDDSGAITMGRESMHLAREGIDDELDVFSRHWFDGFLDDMVAILVTGAFENMMFKFLH